jgi:hypothetical protein
LKIFFACFGILISSCSHTSKVSESSAVQALNGNNYQSPVSGAGGGLSLRDGYSITRISGELLYEGGAAMPEPLRYQKIVLMRDQKAIARVMTDAGGAFVIAAEIPNGVYVITLDCKQRNQSRHFSMEPRRQSTIFVGLTSTIS